MTTKISKLKRITRGGKRRNSGRKAVEDPKVQTSCYLLTSRINALGGMDSVRSIIIHAVENEYQRSIISE